MPMSLHCFVQFSRALPSHYTYVIRWPYESRLSQSQFDEFMPRRWLAMPLPHTLSRIADDIPLFLYTTPQS